MSNIKFGTSGWRDKIADKFTFSNVKIVTQAIADYINEKNNKQAPKIIIGYDTRFLSEKFAETSAKVMEGNNVKVLLTDRDTPIGVSRVVASAVMTEVFAVVGRMTSRPWTVALAVAYESTVPRPR